ncbi:hypothetical protein ES703_121729 [subsurface metagenome]
MEQLRLAGADIRIQLKLFHQRLQPTRGNLHIVIQEHHIFTTGVPYAQVVGRAVADVAAAVNHRYRGIVSLHKRYTLIGGAVVHHKQLGVRVGGCQEGIEAALEKGHAIVVEDDDGNDGGTHAHTGE